jgi:hypothetical protein
VLLRLTALAWLLAGALEAQDQSLRAQAAIESARVYVGQSVAFQIKVDGSDSPDKPNLAPLMADFTVEESGGGASNSQSITIVNGRMSRTVQQGYTFNYQITPRRQGVLAIPSLEVRADTRLARTQPMRVEAIPPSEIEDFKLRQSLSSAKAYVGQPVTLTTVWYIGRNADQFKFQVPVLEDSRFQTIDPKRNITPTAQNDYFEAPLNDTRVIAKKGRGTLNGYNFVTVTFEKLLAALEPGQYQLPASTVAFRAVAGMRGGGGSLFDDFFGGGVFGTRARYESFAIPSNRPALEVLPLPEEGRPANFSGLIGKFAFEAQATPTDVNVGDPITLTVKVTGPEYLDFVRLPNFLDQSRLTADFRVPDEMAPGEKQGEAKVFTQTIRARTARAAEIPPLEFNFLDPTTGRYVTAGTEPIPLTVHGQRIVTAADAEGLGPEAVEQARLESTQGGIAQNYENLDALQSRPAGLAGSLRSPFWLAVLIGPPLAFLGLWAWTLRRRRQADPRRQAVGKAFRRLEESLDALHQDSRFADELLGGLREYLGARLDLPAGAMTFRDVKAPLEARGAEPAELDELRGIFETCEASRYAGGSLRGMSPAELREKTRRLLGEWERRLGGPR